MIRYALVDMASGEIAKSGIASKERAVLLPDLEVPGFQVFMTLPEDATDETHMLDTASGEWVERPAVPEPSANYDLTALPAGTTVTVIDESGAAHEITDLSEALTLEGPQKYIVTVESPFPYMRVRSIVEVS